MPHKKFNELQDQFFEVSKQMHEAGTIPERVVFLDKLQDILQQSKRVLAEIHKKTEHEQSR